MSAKPVCWGFGDRHHQSLIIIFTSPQMLHSAKRLWMWLQSMYDRKQLVGSYNWLCSKLLDVQVTLSQNKPQTMSDQDRNVAAAKFQHSMQVSCAPQMSPGVSIWLCSCLREPQNCIPQCSIMPACALLKTASLVHANMHQMHLGSKYMSLTKAFK